MKKAGHSAPLVDLDSPDVCYCLAGRRSARFLTRIYERHLEPVGLTSSQFSILSLLEHHAAMTVAELARGMGMERTTLIRTLKPLKDQGFVVEGHEKQGRAIVLFADTSGLSKLAQAKPYWEAAQQAFEDSVGKTQAARFRELAVAAASHED